MLKSYRVIFVSRVNIFFEVAFFFFLLDSLKNYNTVFIVLSRAISINLRRDFFFFLGKKRGRHVNEDYFSLFKVSQPEKRVHY